MWTDQKTQHQETTHIKKKKKKKKKKKTKQRKKKNKNKKKKKKKKKMQLQETTPRDNKAGQHGKRTNSDNAETGPRNAVKDQKILEKGQRRLDRI